jgi:hypothetical protein
MGLGLRKVLVGEEPFRNDSNTGMGKKEGIMVGPLELYTNGF